MAGEIIGEIIMFGVEMGLEAAGGGGDGKEKSGCGCVVALVIIIGGLIALYYSCKS